MVAMGTSRLWRVGHYGVYSSRATMPQRAGNIDPQQQSQNRDLIYFTFMKVHHDEFFFFPWRCNIHPWQRLGPCIGVPYLPATQRALIVLGRFEGTNQEMDYFSWETSLCPERSW